MIKSRCYNDYDGNTDNCEKIVTSCMSRDRRLLSPSTDGRSDGKVVARVRLTQGLRESSGRLRPSRNAVQEKFLCLVMAGSLSQRNKSHYMRYVLW